VPGRLSLALALSVALVSGIVFFGHDERSHAHVVAGIHKIRHVVVIMQENRSFDSYFGTYPGADGIPPGVCVPDPAHGGCQQPFHDPNDLNAGGPHGQANATADVDAGRMDGFVAQAERGRRRGCRQHPTRRARGGSRTPT
jgi:Phosphoesterase family